MARALPNTPADQATARLRPAAALREGSRYIGLLAAWVATCGSLFMSEVLRWTPCVLCWYQRILMYPLAVIIAVGILRRDRGLHLYVLPLASFGACVSLYHYLLIKTTLLPPPACSLSAPCTVDYINWLGFINIPLLALAAFLIIIATTVFSLLFPPAAPAEGHQAPGRDEWAVFGVIAAVVLAFVFASRLV